MGQYHLPVNLDRREFIDPHQLGDGLKLMEMASSSYGVGMALLLLLGVSAKGGGRGGGDPKADDPDGIVGRWGGDRVAIVGDYAEDDDLPPTSPVPASEIYWLCREDAEPDEFGRDFTDISPLVCAFIEREEGGKFCGNGCKHLRRVGDEVTRWSVKAGHEREQETGKIEAVNEAHITIRWGKKDSDLITYPLNANHNWFWF